MTETRVIHGIDLDKLEAFRTAIQESPVTLGLEARSVWEGHTGRNTTHIGPFKINGEKIDRPDRQYDIQYGAWKEVEETIGAVGPEDRMEPVEMVLSAIGACLSNSIGLNVARHNIPLDGMEITVSADVDPSVLFEVKGPEAHTACIPNISCDVKVKGDLTDEQLAEIKRLIAYSPVHGMVAEHNDIKSSVTRQ